MEIMEMPQNFNWSDTLSNDEYEVIYKFLALYKNQSVIVADSFSQDFKMVPLEENIVFTPQEDLSKCTQFCRKIYHKRKTYIVQLELCSKERRDKKPDYSKSFQLNIITSEHIHPISFNKLDAGKEQILFHINKVFDERRIISPGQAYCKQMYTDTELQRFIVNHDWKTIKDGIKQAPTLANALFIIKEGYNNDSCFTADFGTILYQLISFRQNHPNDFDEKDLVELDKLIFQLRKQELLKVRLLGKTSHYTPILTSSVLLESGYQKKGHRESQLYNVANTGLLEEEKLLNERIRSLKK